MKSFAIEVGKLVAAAVVVWVFYVYVGKPMADKAAAAAAAAAAPQA